MKISAVFQKSALVLEVEPADEAQRDLEDCVGEARRDVLRQETLEAHCASDVLDGEVDEVGVRVFSCCDDSIIFISTQSIINNIISLLMFLMKMMIIIIRICWSRRFCSLSSSLFVVVVRRRSSRIFIL